jgi:hypothetical protein
MTRKSFLTLIFVSLTCILQAQIAVYKSGYRIAGTGNDYGDFIKIDAAGNVYVAGRFSGPCDMDPSATVNNLLSSGVSDIYLAKYNSAGVLQWSFAVGGTGSERPMRLAIDQNNDLYLVGDFNGSIDVEPGAGSTLLTSTAGNDAFVAKYSSSGQLLFAFSFGGANTDYVEAIDFDSNGNFYIGGEFSSPDIDIDPGTGITTLTNSNPSSFSYDPYVAKFNSSGVFQWGFNLPGNSSDYIKDLSVDNLDRVVVGGYFSNPLQVEPVPGGVVLTSAGGIDCFVARYSNTGSYDAAWSFGGTAADQIFALNTSNNDIITTGSFNSTIDLAPGTDTLFVTSQGFSDIFVSRYTSNGTISWGGNIGGISTESSTSIIADANGDVFVTGSFIDSADFNLSQSRTMTYAYGDRDGFIAKYNGTNGSHIWTQKMGGVAIDDSRGVAFTSNGEFWTTGYYSNNPLYLNPLNIQNTLPNAGLNDSYFARYGECSFPLVTLQPLNDGACPGGDVSYSIAGSGQNITYQWQEGTNGGITWNNITDGGIYSGGTTATLNLTGVGTTLNNRFYRCIISADCGLSTTTGVGILFVGSADTTVIATSGSLSSVVQNATYQWLNCNSGFSPVSGATGQTFNPTANGSYALEITRNGCTDTSSCYTITTAGVYDLDLATELKMYPVPAGKVLNIEMSIAANYEASVFDLSGRNLLTSPVSFTKSATLQLDLLDSGVYLVGIKKNGGELVFTRFIKN